MQEIWKTINDFEGYIISNFGNLISLKNSQTKYLTKRINKKGYVEYKLTRNGKSSYYKAHRLVAKTFIPNPENKPQVNHIDGNKQNNHVDNLEWCTNSENQLHAYRNVLKRPTRGHLRHNARPINQYDLYGNFIQTWSCIKYASDNLNIHRSNIILCCQGIYKSTHGFIFKYAD